MEGFSFCFDCMRHHRKGWVGSGAHLIFGVFRGLKKTRPVFREEGAGTYDPGPSLPAIGHRVTDDWLRPDEQNLAKEIRLAAREFAEAGKMNPRRERHYKMRIAKATRQYGEKSKFLKETEIELVKPHDLYRNRKIQVGFGDIK